jgi:hypothetical protein
MESSFVPAFLRNVHQVFVTVNWEFIFGNFMEHILLYNGVGLNVAIMGKSHCVMNE